MKRRDFIFCLSGIGALVPLYNGIPFLQNFLPENDTSNYKFLNSNSNAWINTKLPERKRSPFGWDYFEIPASSGEHVAFTASEMPRDFKGKIYLRLLIALEVRDKREIGVYLAKSGISIGTIPVWCANSLQLFECELKTTARLIREEGVMLKLLEGTESLYCYTSSASTGSHVYLDSGDRKGISDRFQASLCSIRSIHPFGWMEGCVTDGLEALAKSRRYHGAERTLKDHFRHYLPDNNNLVYEDNHGYPKDNILDSVERGLPLASLIHYYPEHSCIKTFTDYCESRIEKGKVRSKSHTTEGCYHLAYPLAVLGKVRNHHEWCEIALIELTERIHYLTTEDAVFQRASKDGTGNGFRNWARGYAWFLLGLVRSYEVLKGINSFKQDSRLNLIQDAVEFYGNLALKHQQPDGGWFAYLDLPETGFDASGTAGIGSALMYTRQLGWKINFDKRDQAAVKDRLEKSLTSDGFLRDNCQVNRGGEELQKGGYRVISQYAMGLMAHLYT